jgi:hypothetical protein
MADSRAAAALEWGGGMGMKERPWGQQGVEETDSHSAGGY